MSPKHLAASDLADLLTRAAAAGTSSRPVVFVAADYETAARAATALTDVGVVAYPVSTSTGPGQYGPALALGTRESGFSWD